MPLVISREQVKELLPVEDCIEALRAAHVEFSTGRAIMPVRLVARLHERGILALMPAWLDDGPRLGVKVVSSFYENPKKGLPMISATVLLFDAETGQAKAIMDGAYLTELRTAAASAVATAELARADASRLALLGAGVQARSHLRAVAAVRALSAVTVCSSSVESAQRFVDEEAAAFPDVPFRAVSSADEAVRDADVVCAVSSAPDPLFRPESIAPGTHINGVGSHTPSTREIPGETMRDARVIVDSREANLSECGDCMIPIAEGLFGPEHVSDELGQLLAGSVVGRTSDGEITVYQSCGIAIQDVAAAAVVYARAVDAAVGTHVEL